MPKRKPHAKAGKNSSIPSTEKALTVSVLPRKTPRKILNPKGFQAAMKRKRDSKKSAVLSPVPAPTLAQSSPLIATSSGKMTGKVSEKKKDGKAKKPRKTKAAHGNSKGGSEVEKWGTLTMGRNTKKYATRKRREHIILSDSEIRASDCTIEGDYNTIVGKNNLILGQGNVYDSRTNIEMEVEKQSRSNVSNGSSPQWRTERPKISNQPHSPDPFQKFSIGSTNGSCRNVREPRAQSALLPCPLIAKINELNDIISRARARISSRSTSFNRMNAPNVFENHQESFCSTRRISLPPPPPPPPPSLLMNQALERGAGLFDSVQHFGTNLVVDYSPLDRRFLGPDRRSSLESGVHPRQRKTSMFIQTPPRRSEAMRPSERMLPSATRSPVSTWKGILKDHEDKVTPTEELQCCICRNNQKNVFFEPCGHLQTCGTCSIALKSEAGKKNLQAKCPLCRSIVTGVRKVFL